MRRFGTRAGQRVEAVHQQRPRRLRPDRGVERQQIGLGVPEDMAEIGISGQAARADRNPRVVGVGGAGKVVDGETQGLLQLVIAPRSQTSPATQRALQAASCSAAPRASPAAAAGQGGPGGRGGRVVAAAGRPGATATMRSNSATCPARNASSNPAQRERTVAASGAPSSPKRCGARHRDALPVPSVRQAPRSGSSRTGSMPSPAIAKLASS